MRNINLTDEITEITIEYNQAVQKFCDVDEAIDAYQNLLEEVDKSEIKCFVNIDNIEFDQSISLEELRSLKEFDCDAEVFWAAYDDCGDISDALSMVENGFSYYKDGSELVNNWVENWLPSKEFDFIRSYLDEDKILRDSLIEGNYIKSVHGAYIEFYQ